MTEHVSEAQWEAFWAKTLPTPEFVRVAEHHSECDQCRAIAHEVFMRWRNYATIVIDFRTRLGLGMTIWIYTRPIWFLHTSLENWTKMTADGLTRTSEPALAAVTRSARPPTTGSDMRPYFVGRCSGIALVKCGRID